MKTATFNGRRHEIILEPVDGLVTSDRDRCLYVGRDLKTKAGLETAIHEALHACSWKSSEEKVAQTAKDIARFLWRLGFRRRK